MKILPLRAELFHADGQTERQADMTKLMVVFAILRTRIKILSHDTIRASVVAGTMWKIGMTARSFGLELLQLQKKIKNPKYILKTPWEAIKVYRGSRGIALLLLNLGTR
jgi:hypothetical protein